jgi:glycerol-3-phosphate acyltransferase PlsX
VLPIAVDAVGGDNAPSEVLIGARVAAEKLDIPVLLVGPEEVVAASGLPHVVASEIIAMGDDGAQGVRRKKDSSLVRAAEAVRDGRASGMVSAGNTGATMASALLRMGRIRGVSRPAIAAPLPVPGETPTVLLDAGANAECQPEWLVQFAQMGTVFSRQRFGLASPRVGLLSIGEEASKGSSFVKEVHHLLDGAPGVNFIGNIEGHDVATDVVDVVVTDGFSGNVVLKTLEGGLEVIVGVIRAGLASTAETRAAADVLAPVLEPLFDYMGPEATGGAVLLGVEGVCIISHGRSSARAVTNAIALAAEMVRGDIVGGLRSAIATPS